MTDVTTPASPHQRTRSRESRAVAAFTALGAFSGVIWLLVALPTMGLVGAPPILLLAALTPIAALVAAYGISARRAWALGAMVPLLVLAIVSGIIETIVALGESRLNIPLGTLVGLWAMAGPSEDPARRYELTPGSVALIAIWLLPLLAALLTSTW